MAVPLLDKGVVVVAVGYDIAPKGKVRSFLTRLFPIWLSCKIDSVPFASVSGNMDLMVSQVRRSVVSVVQQYSHIRYPRSVTASHQCSCLNICFGTSLKTSQIISLSLWNSYETFADVSGLYLCGHSAGAHLAAMVLSTDWSQYNVTPQIKGKVHHVTQAWPRYHSSFLSGCPVGALLVSGIYDLLPILSTYVNEPLKMTEYVPSIQPIVTLFCLHFKIALLYMSVRLSKAFCW